MSRILVVDFSRTGNTRKLAEAVAQACGGDLEEIRDARPRMGLWGWLRSGREAWRGLPAEIQPTSRNPADYDLVVLGSPVWAGRVSSPMRRYLQDQSGNFDRIALFVTEGGTRGAKALSEMAELAGQSPVATLELREKDLKKGWETWISDFVRKIELLCRQG